MNLCFASYSYALFLASRQHVKPVLYVVPATLALDQVIELNLLHEQVQVLVGYALDFHVLVSVRIDDLVSQRANRHVRFLR